MKFIIRNNKEKKTEVGLYLKSVEDGVELWTTNEMCLMVFIDSKFKRIKCVEEDNVSTDINGRIIELNSWEEIDKRKNKSYVQKRT